MITGTYTILIPEERVVGINDRGAVVHTVEHRDEASDDADVVESLGCEYSNSLVFGTEKDLRNVLFWCMNSTTEDELYKFYFQDRSLRCRDVIVQDAGPVMGHGLFASKDIGCTEPMTDSSRSSGYRPVVIGEYAGLLVNSASSGDYSMAYYISSSNGFDQNWQVDAKEVGNLMRFINHSSSAPNVKFENVFYGHLWHVLVVSAQSLYYSVRYSWYTTLTITSMCTVCALLFLV